MMSLMMMPRSEIKSVEVYDQEWDPTVPNGYEMFDVSLIPSCLGSHADKLHTQKVFHLKRMFLFNLSVPHLSASLRNQSPKSPLM